MRQQYTSLSSRIDNGFRGGEEVKGRRSLVEKERKGRIERKTDDKGEIGSREVGMNEVKSDQIRLREEEEREGERERVG